MFDSSKRYLIESYKSGNSWYRKYSDGWVEQGGHTNTGTYPVFTFLVPMVDTAYNAMITTEVYNRNVTTNINVRYTTYIKCFCSRTDATSKVYISGYYK